MKLILDKKIFRTKNVRFFYNNTKTYSPFNTNIYPKLPKYSPTTLCLANTYPSLHPTTRSLMPGRAQQADLDDRSLDQSFRADKIEFVVVARIATPDRTSASSTS